jgi:predicted PurR-regulated permease PerM
LIPVGNLDLLGMVRGFFSSLAGPAFSVVGGAFTSIVNLIFLLTLMFYMIRDGRRFGEALVKITPASHQNDVRRLLWELAQVWNAYLRGQLLLGVFIGALVLIAALLLGLPSAPILALIAGILEFIPNLGPFLALIPAALFALFSTSTTMPFLSGVTFALVVIVVWTIIQNIEAVIVVPRIMGESLNLHPVVVIVGVIAGANIAGILGVLLAAPVIASLRVIAQYLYGKLMDRDPFPEPPRRDTPAPSIIDRVLRALRTRRAVVQSSQ